MLKYADVSSDRALELLKSGKEGLTEEEAERRLSKYGKNQLQGERKKSVIGLFFSQFGDVMTAMLIAAACISAIVALFSGEASDLVDTAIIAGIIFLNAVVETVQQYRADKAIEGLKKLNASTSRVRRDGQVVEVDTASLTVGDIVVLEEGDVVPADLRIISSNSLRCDESALTGESGAVEKGDTVVAGKAVNYSNAKNLLFSSTFVVGGSAEGVVTAVGENTEIGDIAKTLKDVKKGETPLKRGLNKLGKVISLFVIAVAALLFILGMVARTGGLLKNFMTAVAVAVAAIPEGLPAVVSVIMAMGVQRMSRENVVIRKLKCVETLGSCSCICTDKTGTLTKNMMRVIKVYSLPEVGSLKDITGAKGEIVECMATCGRVKKGAEGYIGDPTEIALKHYSSACGYEGNFTVTGEIPFSSERKLMSVKAETASGVKVYTKGAEEEVLKRCTHISAGGKTRPITAEDIREIELLCAQMSAEALRVLAFAKREDDNLSEEQLTFIGVCGMMDEIKEGVKEAVSTCRKAGITTVMITGDSAETAFAIAKKAGITYRRDEVISGDELDNMTKPQLKEAVKRGKVFARVSPKHKDIIVKLKKRGGEVVAMTGDGVNDAPSVKEADIGIVMGKSGTEVTKSVADMIITDDNFTTIVTAVKEGRRISSNIKKTIQFFLSTNLAEVLAIVIATVLFFGCEFLPSTQLLWINLITDSFPVLALGVERGERDSMNHPPVRTERALFSRRSIAFTLCSAVYITGATVIMYALTYAKLGAAEATTAAFLTLSFAELFHAFNVRSGENSAIFGLLANKTLLITVVLGVAVNVGLCLSPLAPAFGIASLPAAYWLAVFGVSLSTVLFGEIYKAVLKIKPPTLLKGSVKRKTA